MRRVLFTAALLAGVSSCATGPLQENPLLLRLDRSPEHQNPIYLPQGPMAYARVIEKVEDVLSDYFVLASANRYDGRIETLPTIAPGIEQPWRPGSPDLYGRLLAFCQTIRHRAVVQVSIASNGGYFLDVKVFRELEDLPAPGRATAGEATYRLESTVQRQNDVIDVEVADRGWIPLGRDGKLEQVILDRISRLDQTCPRP